MNKSPYTGFSANGPNNSRFSSPINEQDTVDLTSLTQELLDLFDTRNANTIMRFDHLPGVFLSQQDAYFMFQSLLRLIFEQRQDNKLYLYIKCEEETSENYLSPNKFRLCFHTNLSFEQSWMERKLPILQQCSTIAAENNGSLTVAPDGNGCLFTLLLPGKLS